MTKIIILTGGTGTGKTTILKKIKFENTIYLDQYIKDNWYVKGHSLFNKIVSEFGNEIVEGNNIDTAILGKYIFSDEGISNKLIEKLNSLVFPYIIELFKNIKAKSDKKLCIIEMAIYMNHVHIFSPYVDKVIQLISNKQDVNEKFKYLDKKNIPLKNIKISADLYVTRDSGEAKIVELINSITK